MADAGSSVDAGHEEQKSEHGELREAGLGLERLDDRRLTNSTSIIYLPI